MNTTQHTAHVLSMPMHERLRWVQMALETGAKDLKACRAEIDPDGQLTVHTDRGPVYMWAKDLAITQANAEARYRERMAKVRPVVRILQPRPAKAPPPPVPATVTVPAKRPQAKPEPLPHWSAHRIPLGCAPKRAVGNFSTIEARARSIQDLRDNYATAMAGGHTKLAKVFAAALVVAAKRDVDESDERICKVGRVPKP